MLHGLQPQMHHFKILNQFLSLPFNIKDKVYSSIRICSQICTRADLFYLVPAGRRGPGNQSGREKEGGGQSLLGKTVQGKIRKLCSAQASRRSIPVTST